MEAEVKMFTPGPNKGWLVKTRCDDPGVKVWFGSWQVTAKGEISFVGARRLPRPVFLASREAVIKWHKERQADQARAVPFDPGDSQD